jgi:hypothetical protein
MRPNLPRNMYLQLLAEASDGVRKKLQTAHPHMSREIQDVIAGIANRMATRAAAVSRIYVAARSLIEALHADGRLGETELKSFAEAGKFEESTVALALLCIVPIAFAERAMLQVRPETILIMTEAAGYSWATVKALLELRARSCGLPSDNFDECLTSFEGLKRSTAEKVIQLQRLNWKATSRPS